MREAKVLAGVLWMLVFCTLAEGQVLQIGSTTVRGVGFASQSGSAVVAEWGNFARNPKTTQLLAWLQRDMAAPIAVNPQAGFQTAVRIRFTRAGVSTDFVVRETFIPLNFTSARYRGASAALVLVRCDQTPQLIYPRLLVRRAPGNWHLEEYSFRRDGRVTLMAAKQGDCLFRSALKILEQRTPAAHTSLRAVLNATASNHAIVGLQRSYDVRFASVGQRDLAMVTGVFVFANFEEEFDGAYVTGTIDAAFKPASSDSALVKQIKALSKSILKELGETLGKALVKILLQWLGL